MITTALPEGEDTPELFFMDVRDVPWDGSAGITLIAPWNGHGMIATQSHGMRFEEYPVTRCAWPGSITQLGEAANAFISCLFTAVIVGIAETALTTRANRWNRRKGSLRAYEQVEWTRVEMEGWLIQQAYEGMLHAVEADADSLRAALLGKTAIAELAESVTRRICRVMGGGTYSTAQPLRVLVRGCARTWLPAPAVGSWPTTTCSTGRSSRWSESADGKHAGPT